MAPFLATEHLPIPEKDIISWYFDEPQYDHNQPVYIDALDTSRSVTAHQARTLIRQLVAGFRSIGLKEGDCVCIHSFNDLHYPIIVNGIVAFGGIYAGTNPAYQQAELIHHIKTAKVRALVVEPGLLDPALKAARETGIPEKNIFIFDRPGFADIPKGFRSWRVLLEHGEQDWVRLSGEQVKHTTAARLFSSGTTGLPKAVTLTHYNLIAQHGCVMDYHRPHKHYETRRLMALPFFHAASAPAVHFSALRDGSKAFVVRRFELEPFLKLVEKHQITEFPAVPPLIIAILGSPLADKRHFRSLKLVTCGAAPLDKEPQARFRRLLQPSVPFVQVWGMTETSCVASQFPYPQDDDTGSVGYPVPGVDVKLADDNGKDITGYGVRGELCVRGPTIVSGYFENPEANARDWDSEGFFHTGDIAYCDKATKKWYIVDRKKELIKVRGFQVAPPEIEGVLLGHPHIVDAAVIGVTLRKDDTELPRAYIVRRTGDEAAAELSERDVRKHVEGALARYKWLEGGVRFLDAIPKNASGKILKRTLREMAEQEVKAKL